MQLGLDFDIEAHPNRDAGVRMDAANYLRSVLGKYEYALVIFDHEGSGAENVPPQKLEAQLECELAKSGWGNRCAAIVIAPELEAWVWSGLHHVAKVAGLSLLKLQEVIAKFPKDALGKPKRPKEAWDWALRKANRKSSARLFGELAEVVGLHRCQDGAFQKLSATLKGWFSR